MSADIRVTVSGDASGARKAMGDAAEAAQGFAAKAKEVGDRIKSGIGDAAQAAADTAKAAMSSVSLAIGALLATAAVGGFRRFTALEDATAMLDQMGLSANQSEALMGALNNTLTGTAFALDEGAGVMAKLVGSSMPLSDIPGRLDLIADAAAFGKAPLSEVGDIFNRIGANGRVATQDLQRLADRNIPAFALLADQLGVTESQLRQMVSAGEVDADTFFRAWEEGAKGFGETGIRIEGAAQSMGDTTRGAISNAMAAINRFGARGFARIYEQIGPLANAFGSVLDGLAPSLAAGVDRLMDSPGMTKFLDFLLSVPDKIDPWMERLGNLDRRIVAPLAAAFGALGIGAARAIPVLGQMLIPINPIVAGLAALVAVSPALRGSLMDLVGPIREMAESLGERLEPLLPVVLDAVESLGASFVRFVEALLPVVDAVLDVGTQLLENFGPPVLGAITGVVSTFADVIGWLNDDLGILAPLLFTAGVAWATWKGIGLIATGVQAVTAAFVALRTAMAAHPLLAAAGVITTVAVALGFLGRSSDDSADRIKGLRDEMIAADDAAKGFSNSLRSEMSDDDFRWLHNAGVSLDEFSAAAVGTDKQWQAMIDRLGEAAHYGEHTSLVLAGTRHNALEAAESAQIYADDLEMSTEATDEFGNALDGTGKSARDMADDLSELQREMDDYLDTVWGSINAEGNWYEQLRRLNESFKENGTSLDHTTEAGYKNTRAIESAQRAATAHITELRKQGVGAREVTREVDKLADELYEMGRQSGLSSEEARRLSDQLRNIPNIRRTVRVDVDPDGHANRALQRLNDQMRTSGFHNLNAAFRAAGGPVEAGRTYVVGERGPELLHMPRDGVVIPNHSALTQDYLSGATGGSTVAVAGGGGDTYNVTFNAANLTAEQIEEMLARLSRRKGKLAFKAAS